MEDKVPLLPEQTAKAPTQSNVFAAGARWEKLTFATVPHKDPLDQHLYEPTISQELLDLEHTQVEKYDFIDTFNHSPF